MEKNKQKKAKSSDPWARSGERPGRGHGSELFFSFFHGFLQFGQNLENTKKNKKRKSSDPWAKSGLSTHKPKNQKNKKTRNQKNKKKKKTRNQKTKKTKNQKTKKNKKNKIAHPKGRGSDAECWVLSFCFFLFFWFFVFLVFCFFVFLVCVWIAIADVPSRDCQAPSVVALEARSIHYSTALFAMT